MLAQAKTARRNLATSSMKYFNSKRLEQKRKSVRSTSVNLTLFFAVNVDVRYGGRFPGGGRGLNLLVSGVTLIPRSRRLRYHQLVHSSKFY